MKVMLDWVRMPTNWIESGGLSDFRWQRGTGADNLAALLVFAATLHHADQESGVAKLTYNELCDAVSISRAKVSAGLDILQSRELVECGRGGRSSLQLCGFDPEQGWAKFPARRLYRGNTIAAFSGFTLRAPAELDAVKLYYLFASRRDRRSNLAKISYDKISEYSGINRANIRRGLSVLAVHALVHMERVPSHVSEYGVASAYRLAHLDSYRHPGTAGRTYLSGDLYD